MAEVVFTPDRAAMRSFLSGGSGPAFRAVKKMQQGTAARAQAKVPTDKGALKRSMVITPVVVTGNSVAGGVEYRSPYAMFVHGGTKAHIIRPRNAKVLAWIVPGAKKARFARAVRHPGTKAQPWLQVAAFFTAKSQGFDFKKG